MLTFSHKANVCDGFVLSWHSSVLFLYDPLWFLVGSWQTAALSTISNSYQNYFTLHSGETAEKNCLCLYQQSKSVNIEMIYLVNNYKAIKGTNRHKLLNNYTCL